MKEFNSKLFTIKTGHTCSACGSFLVEEVKIRLPVKKQSSPKRGATQNSLFQSQNSLRERWFIKRAKECSCSNCHAKFNLKGDFSDKDVEKRLNYLSFKVTDVELFPPGTFRRKDEKHSSKKPKGKKFSGIVWIENPDMSRNRTLMLLMENMSKEAKEVIIFSENGTEEKFEIRFKKLEKFSYRESDIISISFHE